MKRLFYFINPDVFFRRIFSSTKLKKSLTHHRLKTFKNGQAIVEYILILTVLVFIVTGLMYKFIGGEDDKGVRNWANSIVGDNGYIACLLQTGTLPGKPHEKCQNPGIAPITTNFSSGSSSSSSSGSFDSSGSSSSSSGSSDSSGSSNSSSSSSGSSDSSGSSTAGEGGSGKDQDSGQGSMETPQSASSQSSESSTGKSGKRSRKRGGVNKAHNPDGNLISVNDSESFSLEDETSEGGGGSSRGGGRRGKKKKKKAGFRNNLSSTNSNPGYSGRRSRAISSYGYMDGDQEEVGKRKSLIAENNVSSKKKNSFRQKEKTSRFIIKKKLKETSQDVKIGKWSFGNIFRVVLIILVIAVLVFLIASQTTQVKKSMK